MWMGELGSWWVLGVCAHLWIAFGSAMCGFLQSLSGQISHGWNCSHANTKFALCSNFSLVCQLHWNKFVFSNRHYSTTDFTSQFLEDSLFPLLWSTCLGECEDGSFMHTYFPISYKILDNIKKHKVMSKVPLQCHETDVNFFRPHKNFHITNGLVKMTYSCPIPIPPLPLSQAEWGWITDDWMLFIFSLVIFFFWWSREEPIDVALYCLVNCIYSLVLDLRAFPRVSFIDFRIWTCILDTSQQILHAEYLRWLILGDSGSFILFSSTWEEEKIHMEKEVASHLRAYICKEGMTGKNIVKMMFLEGASGHFQQVLFLSRNHMWQLDSHVCIQITKR